MVKAYLSDFARCYCVVHMVKTYLSDFARCYCVVHMVKAYLSDFARCYCVARIVQAYLSDGCRLWTNRTRLSTKHVTNTRKSVRKHTSHLPKKFRKQLSRSWRSHFIFGMSLVGRPTIRTVAYRLSRIVPCKSSKPLSSTAFPKPHPPPPPHTHSEPNTQRHIAHAAARQPLDKTIWSREVKNKQDGYMWFKYSLFGNRERIWAGRFARCKSSASGRNLLRLVSPYATDDTRVLIRSLPELWG
jgi:hypothetical protein